MRPLILSSMFLLVDACGLAQLKTFPADVPTSKGVDIWGHVEHVQPLLELPLKDGGRMALHAKFNSDESGGRILPTGWTLPFLEAAVWMTSERSATATLPDGQTLPFLMDPTTGSWRKSGKWTADQAGERFTITGPDEEFVFEKGRLRLWKHGKSRYQWILNAKSEVERVEENGSTWLTVSRSGGLGDSMLELRGAEAKQAVAINYSMLPVDVGVPSPDLMGRVYSITTPHTGKVDVEFKPGAEEHVMRMSSAQMVRPLEYVWAAETGIVQGLNGMRVAVTSPLEAKKGVALPQILAIGPDGVETLLQAATKNENGVHTVVAADGSKMEKYVARSPGMSEKMVRKEVSTSAQGITSETYRARLGADGTVLQDQRGEFVRKLEDGVYKVYKDGVLIREY